MATDLTGGGDPFSAAPLGLQQQRATAPGVRDLTGDGRGADPWLAPGWQTGGRVGGTTNAFNDEFFTKMYDQYDEEQQKIADDPEYVSNLFLRDDFTGIVGWDQTFDKDNPVFGDQIDRRRVFRTGDVYENGKFLGNAYDKNSGFTLEEANAYIAPHVFGDRAADKYKDADGDQQKLKDMILANGQEQGRNVDAYISRIPYQKDVDALLKEWDQSILDEALTVTGGIAGGVVAGVVGGPWGMLAGGILGGVGSLMNKDETLRRAAQAVVSTGLIGEDVNPAVASAHAVSQWSNIALTKLNVFSNLLAGGTDVFSGKWDDEESEAQRAALNGNVGAVIGQGIAGFVDGMLTASSGAGMATYMGLAEGSAVSAAAGKAMGDGEWDEVSGSFHRYETVEQRLAAAGASSIDVAQGLLPGVLRRSAAAGIGGSKNNALADLGTDAAKQRVMVMDQTYLLERTGNTIVATGKDKFQSALSWFAPSSIVSNLSVRSSALMESARRGGTSVGADDLYRAALRMEQATVPWKLAMINGFGEATEEVLQTYLNATAVGWQAETMEYVQAAIAGFSMGAGMSVGARLGTVSEDRRQLFRANSLAIADGRPVYDKQTWKNMDKAEKARVSTPTRSAERTIRIQNKQQIADWAELAVQSAPALYEQEDALRTLTKAKTPLTAADGTVDALELMSDIIPVSSAKTPSHHVGYSLKSVVDLYEDRAAALAEQLLADPENTQLNAVHQQLRTLLDTVLLPAKQAWDSDFDPQARQIINETLQAWWLNGDRNQKRAVELVFSRSPNDNAGSFAMLLPQVDEQLTNENIHGSAKITQALEKVLSHDNDGDKLKHQARFLMDDASRSALRQGVNLWSSTGGAETSVMEFTAGGNGFLNIANREYEDKILRQTMLATASTDLDERGIVAAAFDEMIDFLKTNLKGAVEPKTLKIFRKNLDLNPEGAKAEFYKNLSQDAGRLLDLGKRGNKGAIPAETNIGLWIEDVIQTHLQDWREGAATRLRIEVLPPEASGTLPPPTPSDLQSSRGVPAATKGQTLEMRTGGADSFRSRASLAYGTINSSSVDAQGVAKPDALLEGLTQWYSVLTRLRPWSQIDTVLQGGNPVLREARTDLETIARVYYSDFIVDGAIPDQLLLSIAATPFWNVSDLEAVDPEYDVTKFTAPDTTIGQVLLRSAAERQSRAVPTPAGEMDSVAAYAKMSPGQATIQLVGEIPLDRLLTPTEAEWLGPYQTLRSLSSDYSARPGLLGRQEWRQRAAQHPSYGAFADENASFEYGSEPNFYRLVVDLVRQGVDKELAHDFKGTGHAVGRLANEDRSFHRNTLIKTFEALHSIVLELTGNADIGVQGLMDRLSENTQTIQYLLRMFTPEQRLRIIQKSDQPGTPDSLVLPQWFFDILIEQDAERAAMLFFNANFDMEWEAYSGKGTPSNTWIDLYANLDEKDRAEFNNLRANEESVLSFVDRVNQKFATDRNPMLAWKTDTSLYDPSPTRGGWQWTSPSAERRQAVNDAHRYITNKATTLRGDLDLSMTNLNFAQKMKDDLAGRDDTSRRSAELRLRQLEARLRQAKTFSNAAMGPSGIREFVMMAREGLDIASANKGEPGPSSKQFGDVNVRRDQSSFDSQFGQAIGAVAATDAASLKFNPQMLTRQLRIQTNDGVTINWDPVNAESFLDLFTADDGAYQGLLFDLISPAIYEENSYGAVQFHHLLPKDLEAIVTSSIHKELLLGSGSRDQHENDELFIAYMNALTPDNNVVRLMAKIAVARTTASRDAQQTMGASSYQALVRDVAEALRDLSSLTPEGAKEAGQVMRVDAMLSYLMKTGLEDEARAFETGTMKLWADTLKTDAESKSALYKSDPSEAAAVALYEAMQRSLQATALIDAQLTSDVMVAALKIQWGTPNEKMVREAITAYIENYGGILMTSATGDDREALVMYDQAPTANDGLKTFGIDNQKTWEKLSEIVAVHNGLRSSNTRAASFVPTPQVEDMQYFDPTFWYIGEYLVSDEIYNAAKSFRDVAVGAVDRQKSATDFKATLKRNILAERYLGTWTQDLITQHLAADRAMDASGAAVQVAIGGLAPQNYIAADIAASRTNDHPPAELAREMVIDPQQLKASKGHELENTLFGEPWAILQGGHVVAPLNGESEGPVVVVRDNQGVELERIALGAPALRNIWEGGRPAAGATTTIKALDLAGLRDQVGLKLRYAQRRYGKDITTTVELKMFHPADKPAEAKWANNIHFDGTLGSADAARSLYSALTTQTAGLVQQLQRAALDAIKGFRAILTNPNPRDLDNKPVDQLNLVIHQMVQKVLTTKIADKYYLSTGTYRALYRMMRDHIVVAGEAADGTTQILSSEQVLTGALPEELSNLRVVELSRETLETLRGSTSGSGHPRVLNKAPLPGGEGEQWTGSFTPEQLSRVPQLGTVVSAPRDVGQAFRSSGLLSTERSTTYRYKSWTAASSFYGHRDFVSFNAERQVTRDARREVKSRKFLYGKNGQVEKLLQTLGRDVALHRNVDEGTKDALLADIGGVQPDRITERGSEARTLNDLYWSLRQSGGRVWQFVERGEGQRTDGVLTDFIVDKGEAQHHISPVDDVVWIDLASFDGSPMSNDWQARVREVLTQARGLGLMIAFKDTSDGTGVLQAESLLLEAGSGYGRMRGNLSWMYAPNNPENEQQTLLARDATFLESQVQSLENTAVIALDDTGYVVADAEGVLIDPRSDENNFGASATSNIVPSTGYAAYGAPASARAGARVASALRRLNTVDGVSYLARQALLGDGVEVTDEAMTALIQELTPLVSKASQNIDERNGLPKRGTDLEPGDLVVLVHVQTGKLLITRWGYDPSDVDFAAQDESSFDGISRDGIPSTTSIRFVGTTQIPQDKASLNRGRIQRWVDDPRYGLRVIQTMPISVQATKIIGMLTGKKSRGVNATDRLPSVPLLGSIWPNFYDNGRGRRKKGATSGMITNAREGIFFFGWDAGRALANALQLSNKTFSVADWAALTDDQRAIEIAQVRSALEYHRRTTTTRYTSGAETFDAIMASTMNSDAARVFVEQYNGELGLPAAQLRAQGTPSSLADEDIERQYLGAVLEYLRADGTSVSQVLGAAGFAQAKTVERPTSHRMPPALTDYIDANPGLRTYIQADINARMTGNTYINEGGQNALGEGWTVDGQFWAVTTKDDQGRTVRFTLQTERVDPTGEDNTERVETNRMTATTDNPSNQQQQIAMGGLRLDPGYAVPDAKIQNLLNKRGYADLAAVGRTTGIAPGKGKIRQLTALEQQRRIRSNYVAQGYLVPLDRSGWDPKNPDVQLAASRYSQVYTMLGLNGDGRYQDLVDALVRTYFRAQHDPAKEGVDLLSPGDVNEAATAILTSLTNHEWPTQMGRMPVIHADLVDMIAMNGTWEPSDFVKGSNRRVGLLTSALDSMYSSLSLVAPDGQLEMDGLILSYEKYLTIGGFTASAFPDVIRNLFDANSGRFMSTLDPIDQMTLERGDPYSDVDQELGDPRYLTRLSETPASRLPLPTQTEAARRRRKDAERGETIGGVSSQTAGQTSLTGREFKDEVQYTNAFFRDWNAIRTIVPQLNPFLWLWNPVDVASRLLPEQAVRLVTGTSSGYLGRSIRRGINAAAKAREAGETPAVAQAFMDAFGIQRPYIDEEANALLIPVRDRLLGSDAWRRHIAQETRHRPNDAMNTRRERALQRAVDNVSKLQDVTHGIPPTHQADLYIQGILEHERIENPGVKAADVLRRLRNDPLAFYQDKGRTAHNLAANKIKNIKAAKMTTLGVLVNTFLMPMASSGSGLVNSAGNTLLILAKFRNFWFSSAVHLTGLQGLDAAAAVIMQGKQGGARQRGMQGKIDNKGLTADYISEVAESADLADAFLKSGLSQTGLFMAALAVNALGLTGEDEEARRRRRINELQGLGELYDPLDLANDFRNRDALFLDGLDGTALGWLSALAQTPTEPGQPERSPVKLHWTLNFFVAPIIGLAEFLQTGEFADIVRGYESAMGNMPLINTNFFWDAVQVSEKMYEAATNEVPEDPGALAGATAQFIKIFGTLERATFELAFLNEMVAESDAYMRNPWGLAELNEDGSIERDRSGVPALTEETVEEIDPVTGEVVDRRATRSYEEGLWRAFSQNNQTFAFLATLVTGFNFDKKNSFMRGDQVVSQKTIQTQGLSNEAAEQLFLSVWDPDNEREVLTRDGQEALFRSLHAGTVSAKDPALDNINVTFEQRVMLSEELQRKIFAEGVEVLGLSTEDAQQRMYDMWYGPQNNPYVTPLSDVVWNRGNFSGEDGIPYNASTTYRQLNTTWAQGPDGKLWATGVTRGSLAQFFSPIKTYEGSALSGISGNLDIDGLLNSVDPVANVNLGYRAMTRVDDSLDIPDDQDVIDAINASTDKILDEIKDLNSDLNADGGYGRNYSYGGYTRGGGGSGGGGRSYANNSLMPFLNGMRQPYADNIPQLYINNVNVRRANIRRERFSSERGRLNNQQ